MKNTFDSLTLDYCGGYTVSVFGNGVIVMDYKTMTQVHCPKILQAVKNYLKTEGFLD